MNKEIGETDTYNVCSWGKLGREKEGWREGERGGERGRKRGKGEGKGEKDRGGRERGGRKRVGEGEREGKREGEEERKKRVKMHMMVAYAHKLIVPLPIHPVSNHHPVQSSHYHNIHPFHHLMIHYVISHYQRQ